MTRLPSIIVLLVGVGLTGCANGRFTPLNPDPNKKFQKDDTAYISVFLFKDGAGACKAKVSPETLLVVRKNGNDEQAERRMGGGEPLLGSKNPRGDHGRVYWRQEPNRSTWQSGRSPACRILTTRSSTRAATRSGAS